MCDLMVVILGIHLRYLIRVEDLPAWEFEEDTGRRGHLDAGKPHVRQPLDSLQGCLFSSPRLESGKRNHSRRTQNTGDSPRRPSGSAVRNRREPPRLRLPHRVSHSPRPIKVKRFATLKQVCYFYSRGSCLDGDLA
jgi:hypothetical protein